jgi:hypothetical protein
MNIHLDSRKDITSWHELFTILAFDLCVPLWNLLDIPAEIFENPMPMLEISKELIAHDRRLPLPERRMSEDAIATSMEARRMTNLGCLYISFGKIMAVYGEIPANALFRLGDLHFAGPVNRYWHYWHFFFAELLKPGNRLREALADSGDRIKLEQLVEKRLQEEKQKAMELDVKYGQMRDRFFLNFEQEKAKLRGITSYDDFDDPDVENSDALDMIFSFDLLIYDQCASAIWKDINETFSAPTAERLFDQGITEICSLDGTVAGKIAEFKEIYLAIKYL